MYKIFTNKFYYGEFDWAGQEYKSQQLAMITREEFDRAQIILGRKGKPRPQKYRFPFTGIIKCGTCGCMVTAEHKLKKIRKQVKLRHILITTALINLMRSNATKKVLMRKH